MAVKIFSLRSVPADEADEVRALLSENSVDYYETPGGNWGISMPALWIEDARDEVRAKALIQEYEYTREKASREAFVKAQALGQTKSVLGVFLAQPLQVVLYLLVVFVIAYLSLKPFFSFAERNVVTHQTESQ